MILESIGLSKHESLGESKLTEEDNMPALSLTQAIPSGHSKQATCKPAAEDAAKAKALINFLMEDRLFLALYRSNDPKVRAAAMDKLNEAHHQAYGDASTKDDDACTGRK
jgi:hypothetical protein